MPNVLIFVLTLLFLGNSRESNWTGDFPPCNTRIEFLYKNHMDIGVRFIAKDKAFITANKKALVFWAKYVDMEWYVEDSDEASMNIIELNDYDYKVVDASKDDIAISQDPADENFEGWIAWNSAVVRDMSQEEIYETAVHEFGHLLGIRHNPNSQSVMYYNLVPGPTWLTARDLREVATHHALRPNVNTSYSIRVDNSWRNWYHIVEKVRRVH